MALTSVNWHTSAFPRARTAAICSARSAIGIVKATLAIRSERKKLKLRSSYAAVVVARFSWYWVPSMLPDAEFVNGSKGDDPCCQLDPCAP